MLIVLFVFSIFGFLAFLRKTPNNNSLFINKLGDLGDDAFYIQSKDETIVLTSNSANICSVSLVDYTDYFTPFQQTIINRACPTSTIYIGSSTSMHSLSLHTGYAASYFLFSSNSSVHAILIGGSFSASLVAGA